MTGRNVDQEPREFSAGDRFEMGADQGQVPGPDEISTGLDYVPSLPDKFTERLKGVKTSFLRLNLQSCPR
jgi:hypothetical protein